MRRKTARFGPPSSLARRVSFPSSPKGASRPCCWPLSRGLGSRESFVRRVVRSLVSARARRWSGGPAFGCRPAVLCGITFSLLRLQCSTFHFFCPSLGGGLTGDFAGDFGALWSWSRGGSFVRVSSDFVAAPSVFPFGGSGSACSLRPSCLFASCRLWDSLTLSNLLGRCVSHPICKGKQAPGGDSASSLFRVSGLFHITTV